MSIFCRTIAGTEAWTQRAWHPAATVDSKTENWEKSMHTRRKTTPTGKAHWLPGAEARQGRTDTGIARQHAFAHGRRWPTDINFRSTACATPHWASCSREAHTSMRNAETRTEKTNRGRHTDCTTRWTTKGVSTTPKHSTIQQQGKAIDRHPNCRRRRSTSIVDVGSISNSREVVESQQFWACAHKDLPKCERGTCATLRWAAKGCGWTSSPSTQNRGCTVRLSVADTCGAALIAVPAQHPPPPPYPVWLVQLQPGLCRSRPGTAVCGLALILGYEIHNWHEMVSESKLRLQLFSSSFSELIWISYSLSRWRLLHLAFK